LPRSSVDINPALLLGVQSRVGVDTAESTSRGWSRDGDDDCPCTRPARPLANVLQSSDLNVVRSRHNDGSICAAAAMRAVATIAVATRPSSELLRGRRVAHRVLLQRDRIAEGRQWRRPAQVPGRSGISCSIPQRGGRKAMQKRSAS